MAQWLVRLSGNRIGLKLLEKICTGPDLCVEERDGTFSLKSSQFEPLADSDDVRARAEWLLHIAGLFAGFVLPYRPDFRVAAVRDSRGKWNPYVEAELPPEFLILLQQDKPLLEDAHIASMSPADATPHLVRLQQTDGDIQYVIHLWSVGPHDWYNLYKIWEIIKKDKHPSGIVGKGGFSNSEMRRFTQTANYYRHARLTAERPKGPMTWLEGKAFIQTALKKWLAWKISQFAGHGWTSPDETEDSQQASR